MDKILLLPCSGNNFISYLSLVLESSASVTLVSKVHSWYARESFISLASQILQVAF